MDWLMVILVFDAQVGELRTHTEQLYQTQKQCEDAGQHHTVNVALPDELKASYVCLKKDLFTLPEPEAEPEKTRGFRIF